MPVVGLLNRETGNNQKLTKYDKKYVTAKKIDFNENAFCRKLKPLIYLRRVFAINQL